MEGGYLEIYFNDKIFDKMEEVLVHPRRGGESKDKLNTMK